MVFWMKKNKHFQPFLQDKLVEDKKQLFEPFCKKGQ